MRTERSTCAQVQQANLAQHISALWGVLQGVLQYSKCPMQVILCEQDLPQLVIRCFVWLQVQRLFESFCRSALHSSLSV